MKEPCGIVLRWRLWRVCKRLGIRPYKWQKDYALGKDMRISLWTRRSGKTMAVVLYGLIRKAKGKEAYYVSGFDPDNKTILMTDMWVREYWRLACCAGVETAEEVEQNERKRIFWRRDLSREKQ